MKHLFFLFMGFSWLLNVQAQVAPTPGLSYVIEQTPRAALSAVESETSYNLTQSTVSYVDGLGRPLQSVLIRGAGNAANDLVLSAVTYDGYRRPQFTYLPVSGSGIVGGLTNNVQAQGVAIYNDQTPYHETLYETSPLMKPVQQYGPGQVWRTANKFQTMSYGVGTNVPQFSFDQSSITPTNTYGPNEIATRQTTDEQGDKITDYTDL